MIAIINEMRISAEFEGWLSTLHVCITFMTLIVSWLFIHTLFALYYAHGYYDDNPDDKYPLDFLYENNPNYWDFFIFCLRDWGDRWRVRHFIYQQKITPCWYFSQRIILFL